MSSAESLFKSFIIMIVCLLSSIFIIMFIASPGERVAKELQSTGVLDAPPEWGGSRLIDFSWKMEYFLPAFLSFYGIAQFVYTAIRKQRYDVYGQPIEEL